MVRALNNLLRDVEILQTAGPLDVPVTGIAYDSRRIQAGNVFVALPGARVDGNRFIPEAVRSGARAVITETGGFSECPATVVRVSDSRKAMARMAANYYDRPCAGLKMIGVTGTNGKTTTTLLLESILKRGGHSVGVLGTLFYRWGAKRKTACMTTPESLDLQGLFYEMREDGVTHVVMEVSSHALAQGRVAECAFDAAVFTNLSQDHLDYHVTMEDYFAAKSLLFSEYLRTGSVAVINGDDPYGARLVEKAGRGAWSYSTGSGAARVHVKSARLTASGLDARLCGPDGSMDIHSPLIGRLNLYNILAAVTASLAMGVPESAIREGVAGLASVDGRLQRVASPGTGFEVVVDYAHTPDAMEKSLGCLREMTAGRLLVVFGCGGDRDRGKRPLMGKVAGALGDLVIVTSDNPRSEVPERIIDEIEPGVRASGLERIRSAEPGNGARGYIVEVDRKSAIEKALAWARPGDTVFIGGKGHETYQLVGGEVLPFDDRLVVAQYLARQRE
ncbi:MAG TPA: UDP-N-acetylmuramoyl-L-alanyl-D-glutamate--2,6-diaminopimelate ligase [Syntrophobacter fumaroxidans]|nr:UDP-N-acetylmuramoyl-L-alanyl-D-glutamate--2,6-diaminopimelate ligase [Syntrophobacter fumaroxidans]